MVTVKMRALLAAENPLPPHWKNGEVQMPAAPRAGETLHLEGLSWVVTAVGWEQYRDGTWIAQVSVR
jgi:hypothetical protein